MSNFMGDVGALWGAAASGSNQKAAITKKDNMSLDMTDFITLMVTQLTSQGIDDAMDTSDMLNQMVQMQMVQAMVNMTDASVMNYAASLVGKEVTVANGYDSDGKLMEYTGKVIGTGQYNGEQVVFLDNDKYYRMSEILAVGRLPEAKPPEEDDKVEGEGETEGTDKPEGPDKPEGTDKPEGGGTEGTDKPVEPDQKPEEGTGTENKT